MTNSIKCSATTANGQPCKSWAIKDSDPPLCAPHSGLTGAKKGNTNALTHGYYSQRVKPEELLTLYGTAGDVNLTEEAILLRVLLRRLAEYINDPELSFEKIKSVTPLIVSTSRALGFLQKHLPDPNDLQIDWDATLDELSRELGWDL